MKPQHQAKHALWARCAVAALALVAVGGIRAEAQTTWTGGGVDAFWATGANWGGTAPAANASLVFTGTTQTSNSNNFAADTQFNGITFNNSSTAGSFTLSGNRITLGGNVTTTGATGSPTQTISLDLLLNNNRTFNLATNNNLVVGGNISETGGTRNITVQGGGTLTLNGSNSFGGTVTVNQGKLVVNSLANGGTASAIGAGASAISLGSGGSSASLEYTGTGHSTNRAINLAGSSGNATILANGAGAVTFNAVALLFANGTVNKTLFLDGSSTAANTFASTIGDESGSLKTAVTKQGVGTWTLSGSNTFSRGVALSGGQLNINNPSAIGTGTMRVSNGTKLDNTSGSAITLSTANVVNIDQNFTFGGSNNLSFASGTATVGTQNFSSYTVTMDGVNSTLTFGVLTNAVSTGINSGNPTITVNNGAGTGNKLVLGGLNLSNSSTNNRQVIFSGGANIDITGGIANGTATNADLSYSGSGTLALSGSTSYTGRTSVTGSGGTLQLAKTVSLYGGNTASWTKENIAISSGATLALNVGGSGEFSEGNVSTLLTNLDRAVSGNGLMAGSTIAFDTTNSSGSFTVADSIQNTTSTQGGAVGVAKRGTGTLILSGSSSYTGATAVGAGRLEIASGGRINGSSGIAINGSTAELRYNSATALTQPITLTRGTLSGTGTINTAVSVGANAILSPGNSPGAQTYQSGTFAGGGSYIWEINNWTSGTAGVNYDQAIFTNGLAITSSTASPFTINVTSLQSDNTAGAVPGFNSGLTGLSFNIATGTMTGYSPSAFTLGTSSFLAANTVSGSANGGFWLSTNSGSTVLTLNYAPSARYTLSATPAATAIYAGGSTTITGSITNSTADRTGADTMQFSGLSVGTGSLSVTSGTLASGAATGGTVNFSSLTAGPVTFTPTVSASNVNLGTAALAGTVTSGTVTVYTMAAAASSQTVDVGNFHVGDTATKAVTLANTAPQSIYTETLASNGFSSTSVGFTATGAVSGIAGGTSASGSLMVGFSTGSAGARSGSTVLSLTSQAVNSSGLGTTDFATQTVSITGTVWNYAAATIASGTAVNFGTVLAGAPLSQALSITNSAPATFSEKLDAAFGGLTGGATTNGGPFSLLSASSTNSSSMTVGLGSSTAGDKSGTVQVNFTSNGDGTSGLGTTGLGSQSVSLAATVLDPATALFVGGLTSGSNWLLNLGEFQQGSGTSSPVAFGISNLTQTAGYTADLFLASFVTATNSGAVFTSLSGTSSFLPLGAGGTNSFTAWMSLASTGAFTNVYNLSFNSSKNGASLGGTPQNVTLTVTGVIVVPEPGTLALAGIGAGVAAWMGLSRRRAGRALSNRRCFRSISSWALSDTTAQPETPPGPDAGRTPSTTSS